MKWVIPILLVACGGPVQNTSSQSARAEPELQSESESEVQSESELSIRMVNRPDLAPVLAASGFDGSFAATVATSGASVSEGVCVGTCDVRLPPASTFKAPHALLALDLGVLRGPEHLIAWDGERRWLESWNQDHTLATAIRDSVLWYFQRVAPEIGAQRMHDALVAWQYGNADIGSEIDSFWIDGSLRISPEEQVSWWHGLHGARFGVSDEVRRQVLQMTELARDGDVVLRGKTGWDRRDGQTNHGWFTGCVESPGRRICFATVLSARDPFDHTAFIRARKEVSRNLLTALGYSVPDQSASS